MFTLADHVHFLPKSGKASNYPVGLLTIKSGLQSAGSNQNEVKRITSCISCWMAGK